MVTFLLITLIVFVAFVIGFAIGVIGMLGYCKDEFDEQINEKRKEIQKRKTEEVETGPKYGFAARL